MTRISINLAMLLLLLATNLAQDGGSTQRVEVRNGKTSRHIEGTCDLMNPHAFVLPVRRRQRLQVNLEGEDVLVRLVAPNKRIEVEDSQRIDQVARETGDYTIVVHCRLATKPLPYQLNIKLR